MQAALTALFNKLVQWLQDIFDLIFGQWNYGVLFNWLPQDIQNAVQFLILFLFALALVKLIKEMIPG